jgi:hypothetical protein
MRFVVCLVLIVLTCGLLTNTPAVRATSDCENVRGTVKARIGVSIPDCSEGTIIGDVFDETGTQIGTTTACIITAERKGKRATQVQLTHTYSIGNLNFTTVDEGVLTLIQPDLYRFENNLTIVDGASGFLHAQGTVDLVNSELNLQFSGQICVE